MRFVPPPVIHLLPALSTSRSALSNNKTRQCILAGGVENSIDESNKKTRRGAEPSVPANNTHDREYDDDDDNSPPIYIPPPPRSVLEMTQGGSVQALKGICHPIARKMFQELQARGYVLNVTGKYAVDFCTFADEDCGKHALLYAMFEKETDNLVKIGLTVDLDFRTHWYDNKQTHYFVPFVLLHNFDVKTEKEVLQPLYRAFMNAVQTDEQVPSPVQEVFKMITQRGGEELGVKKNLLDRTRQTHVQQAVKAVVSMAELALDTKKKIEIEAVTSWMTGFHKKKNAEDNPEGKRCNTLVFMEYVCNDPDFDLEETDTIPVPACHNPQNADEGRGFRQTTSGLFCNKARSVYATSCARCQQIASNY
ncbi:unknown protein [Seminavis robusta]|uniref:Uncharacterized protein n=1 Tax=Seminavis robusta TaxID=568900 RepID=A0A9N8HT63_9STRA|nr:unknown protein [Seminavis robusta]|eukprot:Sro1240_g255330.1 n/a (365) ;mRNA; r:7521-8688